MELKNDVSMTGTLVSVDQYLNIKIANAQVVNSEKHPQLVSHPSTCPLLFPCPAFFFRVVCQKLPLSASVSLSLLYSSLDVADIVKFSQYTFSCIQIIVVHYISCRAI